VAVPKIIKNMNLFMNGRTFAGLVTSVEIKVLTLQVEEHRAGGMDAPIDIDMGMEKPTISFDSAEHMRETIKAFGKRNQNAVDCTFRAALIDDVVVEPYELIVRGMITEIDEGSQESGKIEGQKTNISCRYVKLSIGGEVLIEVDIDNLVRIINGIDEYADIRGALAI